MVKLKTIFAAPVFEDENKTRLAGLLNICLWTIIFLPGGYTLIKMGQKIIFDGLLALFLTNDISFISNIVLVTTSLILLLVMRHGYVKLVGLLLVLVTWVDITYQAASLRGVYDSAFTAYFIMVLGAGLLLGRWFGVGMAVLCSLSGLALAYGNTNGLITYPLDTAYNVWFDQTLNFAIAAVVIFLSMQTMEQALQRAQQNERHLAEANRELEAIRLSLEQRVVERTAELAQANQELAKLNKDKDRFFSIVAHDLKGPFMPLLGLSQFLVEMAGTLSLKDITKMGDAIHRSAQNVYNLLENLLHWSRLQQGHMEYNPEQLELAMVAAETVTVLGEVAEAKEIHLFNEVGADVIVYADKNMLDTVIRNLTNNALKFTPNGGKVTISAQAKAESVEVAIVDTGVGMSAEVQAKLFKIDQQVTTSGTNEESGTGLGLIICQEMVIKCGGQIWVESQVGRGTTVKFTVRSPKPTALDSVNTHE